MWNLGSLGAGSSRQVRLWVEVDNKYGWLIPGGNATIVIPPKK